MKHIIRTKTVVLILAALLILVLTGCGPRDSGMVIGDNYRLESGETLNNDLTVIGGNAVLEEDSTVDGDIAVMGGNVSIAGTVEGDIAVMGGNVMLEDTAVVEGQVSSMGGTVQRAPGAQVDRIEDTDDAGDIIFMRPPGFRVGFDPIGGTLTGIFQALAAAALAILVNLFAARQMDLTGRTALSQPIMTGGLGLLTLMVLPVMLIILMITIILIPVSLIGLLILGIAVLFGWLAMGLILGRQVAVWLKQNWSEPVNAGVGTFILALLGLFPCLGFLANLLIAMMGLGAVLLTRFGTRIYPTYGTPAAYPGGTPPYTPPPPPYTPPPSTGARVYEAPATDAPANDNLFNPDRPEDRPL